MLAQQTDWIQGICIIQTLFLLKLFIYVFKAYPALPLLSLLLLLLWLKSLLLLLLWLKSLQLLLGLKEREAYSVWVFWQVFFPVQFFGAEFVGGIPPRSIFSLFLHILGLNLHLCYLGKKVKSISFSTTYQDLDEQDLDEHTNGGYHNVLLEGSAICCSSILVVRF